MYDTNICSFFIVQHKITGTIISADMAFFVGMRTIAVKILVTYRINLLT